MLFGLLLAALVSMDANSYVAPESDGFAVYLAGERLGWDKELGDAERRYRMALLERRTLDAFSCLRAEESKVIFSHTRPNGQNWNSALPARLTGFAVEVLAIGPDLPTVLRAWHESPAHEVNLARPVQEFGFCQVDGYFAAHSWWPVVRGEGDIALVTSRKPLIVVAVVLLILVVMFLLRRVRSI